MEIYMRNYEIENEMYRRAVELIETRYPIGWGGAGVVHTSNGNYSVLRLLTHLLFCASRQVQCLKHINSMKR